jgi:flagellar hook-associated protein 1 FlgK
MGTLSAGLNIAVGAMITDQEALSVVSNNIANANTPGYTRQVAELGESPTVQYGGLTFGNGVQLEQVANQRSSLLQSQLDQQTSQQSYYGSYLGLTQQVQTLFNETSGTGLQSSLTNFFNSLQQLSTSPSDQSLREGVLTSAQNLAQAFNSASQNLSSLQQNADATVTQSVSQINTLTSQIAQLNGQISSAVNTGQNAGALEDQRDQAINQLSGLLDISQIDAGNGNITLTTSSGTALVAGTRSFSLSSQANPTTGHQEVYAQGSDITSSIQGGTLGGTIVARDTAIPATLNQLDSLAAGLENSFNSLNQSGTDLNGQAGGALFSTPPTGTTGAAAEMSVAITDPSGIAAGQDGTSGDNSNLTAMLALQNQNIVNGQTPLSAYSNLVYQIGNEVSNAQSESQSSGDLVSQIQNQIGSVSGVSVNEEAASLIQYQQAYQAAAQVASVMNSLIGTAINLGNGGGVSG